MMSGHQFSLDEIEGSIEFNNLSHCAALGKLYQVLQHELTGSHIAIP
jgi:hypothetical protein